MKKVLLTGFEPFGNYEYNPTKEIAEYYNTKTITGNEHVIGIVLPCTYFGAFKILEKIIDEEQPDSIISIGLSSSVKTIRIETVFQNKMKSKYSDTNGYKPNGIRINTKKGAVKKLIPQVNYSNLASILSSKNIPVEISNDANTFICNSLAYLTTQKILREKLSTQNMFIHIPWTDDYASIIKLDNDKVFIEKNKLYNAIELLIEKI